MKKLLIILLLVAFVSSIHLTEEQKEKIDAFRDYLKENSNLIIDKLYSLYSFFNSILKKKYYETFYYIMRGEANEAKNKCYVLFPKISKKNCNNLVDLLIDLYEYYYETIEKPRKYAPYKKQE